MSDLAVLVEVLAESAETTSNGTVRQHPAGVLTALRQTRPASAVPDHNNTISSIDADAIDLLC